MGGRGAVGGGKYEKASPDGVFLSNEPRKIETVYREARGLKSPSYFKDEVLEAVTDGYGNLTFDYPEAKDWSKTAKTNRTNYVTYEIKAGAVNGKSFNIDWSKVNSIEGKTYNLRQEAKEAGLHWDGKSKKWTR